MKTAAAVVTERGGRTSHAAIIARELGLPAVVGAKNAMAEIAKRAPVTVSCSEGEVGSVYAGELPFKVEEIDLSALVRPKTKIHPLALTRWDSYAHLVGGAPFEPHEENPMLGDVPRLLIRNAREAGATIAHATCLRPRDTQVLPSSLSGAPSSGSDGSSGRGSSTRASLR